MNVHREAQPQIHFHHHHIGIGRDLQFDFVERGQFDQLLREELCSERSLDEHAVGRQFADAIEHGGPYGIEFGVRTKRGRDVEKGAFGCGEIGAGEGHADIWFELRI